MRFDITKDLDLIRDVLTNGQIYPHLHDDYAEPIEEWQPETHPRVSYITVYDGERFLGLVIAGVHSMVQLELHNALLPSVGWKTRLRAFKELMDWLYSYGCRRVIGKVPAYNEYAIKFNDYAGMERIGVNKAAFMKHGKLQDEIWFGMSLQGDN